MTDALIVACPACNTLNRAPREKLAAGGGKCGQCGAPLFEGALQDVELEVTEVVHAPRATHIRYRATQT